MGKQKFELTQAEQRELWWAYDHCADGEQRTRLQAVRLYGSGWTRAEVQDITGCTPRSLWRWCQEYRHEGLVRLADQRVGGNRARLSAPQLAMVQTKLQQYSPADLFGPGDTATSEGAYWTVADLRRALERWTGVVYQDPQSYRDVFRRCGFSYQRTERLYRSRKGGAVAAFCEQVEQKLTEVAQDAPHTLVLTEDEASLYLQATTQAVWAPRGQTPSVRVDAGRAQVHFYGTLNLLTGKEVATHEPIMNSEATARHLETLLTTYPDTPILLFWDRAPWHRGEAVQQVLAANPRLAVIFYPTASPDLNPQEQVWKATRSTISHNHDETQLTSLTERFEQHLTTTTFAYAFLEKFDYVNLCARFK
jgi:transposase